MIYEVGSWQHFVKRQDNVGLPIMEVKQKYLMEISKTHIDLLNINGQGGGSRTVSSTPVPTDVYYLIDGWCSEDEFPTNTYTTQLVDPNIYHTGEFVYSTVLNTGVLLGSPQSTPINEVGIIGPVSSGCPVTALESYVIIDCITGQDYISGYYDVGNFALGDRVYTQYGNYGWVQNTATAQEGNQDDGFPIGYVDNRCNDCNVSFSFDPIRGEGEYYLDLLATESFGEVAFQSTQNTLLISVHYYMAFSQEEGPNIDKEGTINFVIPSYNVAAGATDKIGSEYMFAINTENTNLISQDFYVTTIEVVDTALGPYNIDWDVPNKYVTNYGNVWTFYYPT
jgi:hypothetical protein